ncbi:MAG: hypothetical protein J6584_05840 [Lactobacillus sp.]|uniref:hypothetical protein n=1 Tax=Bombilactobacillus bombi TaxID=1303590 RepID=UPI0035EF880B|nr:hypothetical protein [Lactobacillus sp.]
MITVILLIINYQIGSKVAVAVTEHDKFKGYPFEGPAVIHQNEQIFKDATASRSYCG